MKIATFFGIVFCFTASYLMAQDTIQPTVHKIVPIPIEYQLRTVGSQIEEPRFIQALRSDKPTHESAFSKEWQVPPQLGEPKSLNLVLSAPSSKAKGPREIPTRYFRTLQQQQAHPAPRRLPLQTRFSMIHSGTVYR